MSDYDSNSHPNLLLSRLLDRVCEVLQQQRPDKVLTVWRTTAENRELWTFDLVYLASRDPLDLSAYRAHAESKSEITSALQKLANYGYRGDELTFMSRLSGGGYQWVLSDPHTL